MVVEKGKDVHRLMSHVMSRVQGRTTWPAWRALEHRYGRPAIWELQEAGPFPIYTDEFELLHGLFPACDLAALREEFQTVLVGLHPDRVAYSELWDLGRRSAFVLYAVVRMTEPAITLETGVANGLSSRTILSALAQQGTGVLHSVDIRDDVGELIPGALRDRWQLHVLDGQNPRADLRDIAAALPPLDLFIHDSDHSYRHMSDELELAASRLHANGWILVDDADASYAVRDFARERRLQPLFLFDDRKILALLPPPVTSGKAGTARD